LADQRTGIDALAAVLGVVPQFSQVPGSDLTYSFKAALPHGIALVATAVKSDPTYRRMFASSVRTRTTTTRHTAATLRALLPWVATLPEQMIRELTVSDDLHGNRVRLTLDDALEPAQVVATVAGELPAEFSHWSTGAAARAILPTGQVLWISANRVPGPSIGQTGPLVTGPASAVQPSHPVPTEPAAPQLFEAVMQGDRGNCAPEPDATSAAWPASAGRIAEVAAYAAVLREQRAARACTPPPQGPVRSGPSQQVHPALPHGRSALLQPRPPQGPLMG
jgi:hypothetical protein